MTDGQFIAVDLGSGRGKRLQVHDVGGGLWTTSDPGNADKVMTIEPQSGVLSWEPAGTSGEFQWFTIDANIMCFYSVGGNPTGNVRLFGFSSVVREGQ
jgi:hypothetical protein